jgi:hypothetical protein
MHRGALTAFRFSTTFRLVSGSLVLALYLLTATPLAPALTALLALADRGHHLAMQQTSGGIAVVLRHDCFNSPTHRHAFIARTLTLLAQPTSASQPDHVIQFGASAMSAETAIALVAVESAPEILASGDLLPRSASKTVSSQHCHPPPGASGWLWNVRSPVLLI